MSIEIRDLNFSYGDKEILHHINLQIEEGNLLCLLGPNGVGKSTLFRCILGLNTKYTGDIFVNATNIKEMRPEQLAKWIAYIPQSYTNVFSYSALDVVLMGTTARLGRFRSPGKKQMKIAYNALKQLGILHLRDRSVTKISGGEAQLVMIARAIAQQTKILIMDEPTSNLDFGNQTMVMKEIVKLAKQGYTIMLSTHNPEHVFLYANEVLVMESGKIKMIGKPKDVLTEKVLQEIYNIDLHLYELAQEQTLVCVPTR